MGTWQQSDIAIIGAGIAGVAAARYLALLNKGQRITLVDRQQPLSLTTSKSGENFRAYWPQACMADLAARSIELMAQESDAAGDALGMKLSGYVFVSESAEREIFTGAIAAANATTFERETDREQIQCRWPHLTDAVRQLLQVKRAGAIDIHALGSWLLRRARADGARFQAGEVTSIDAMEGGFRLQLGTEAGTAELQARQLLLAAGPFNGHLAKLLGVDLPLENFLQRKIVVPDPLGLVPTDMPFTIFADPQYLEWTQAEREMIGEDPDYGWLLEEFPGGLHIKPEPGGRIKLGWAWNRKAESPAWEPPDDPHFADVVMRGASRFIPALRAYVEDMPTPVVTFSGYYTRTPENWPLIGPLGPPGLFTIAGLSGFGTMAACAAGELVAACMTEDSLPPYARHFHPGRYKDPEIVAEMATIRSDGQL